MVYDIETYPNIFTCAFQNGKIFEISWMKNQVRELAAFIGTLDEMTGFNNVMFDYPVIHFILQNQKFITPSMIFKEAERIIKTPFNRRFSNIIYDEIVPQIDLFLIHHFDNAAKTTSLKALQLAMRSESVEDLPYHVGKCLLSGEIENLKKYNFHDVDETEKFRKLSEKQIDFRREICKSTGMSAMNFNDTKIGKKFFETELEKNNPGCCYDGDGKRQTPRKAPFVIPDLGVGSTAYNARLPAEMHLPKEPGLIDAPEVPMSEDFKTKKAHSSAIVKWEKRIEKDRHKYEKSTVKHQKAVEKQHEKNLSAVWIPVKDVLFDYLEFETPELQEVLEFYQGLNITQTKSGLSTAATINGFTFHFGAGGIHGSVDSCTVKSDDDYVIRDIDVASYYPNLAIKNGLFPEHLGKDFCRIYDDVYQQRKKHKKGTAENAVLKLALNGVFGDSNNQYSVFYDPKYTMAITINGQLLIAMLAEWLLDLPMVELLQVNTDGLTIRYPRSMTNHIELTEQTWEKLTQLELETVNYQAMFIRDVNNYIGHYEGGGVKRKGAYEHQRGWHQNQSGMVIQKAVEAHLINGDDIEEFIVNHPDKFDFMMRGKVNRTDRLVLMTDGKEVDQQKIIRFYFTKNGGELFKYMPPIKGKDKTRRNAYQGSKGWKVKVCNHVDQFENDVDYDYYIEQAQKLVEPLRG